MDEFASEVTLTPRKQRRARTRDDVRNWPALIAAEEPLYRRAFQSAGARRVAVFSTGDGHRARLFARWGMSVLCVVEDPADVKRLQAAYEEDRARTGGRTGDMRIVSGGIEDLPRLVGAERVEAIVCVDDLVTRVDGFGTLRENLQALAESLMAGGVLILATRNYPRMTYRRERMEEPLVAEDATGTRLFTRVVTYDPNGVHVHIEDLIVEKPTYAFEDEPDEPEAETDPAPESELETDASADTSDEASESIAGEKDGELEELDADPDAGEDATEEMPPLNITGDWRVTSKREMHVSASPDVLKNELVHTGFDVIEVAGSHDGKRFALMEDDMLVIVSRRKKPRTTVHLDR